MKRLYFYSCYIQFILQAQFLSLLSYIFALIIFYSNVHRYLYAKHIFDESDFCMHLYLYILSPFMK